jgi:hypothetical protein
LLLLGESGDEDESESESESEDESEDEGEVGVAWTVPGREATASRVRRSRGARVRALGGILGIQRRSEREQRCLRGGAACSVVRTRQLSENA